MTIRDAQKDLRERPGVTQEQFARYMNVTLRTVSRYETEDNLRLGPFLKRLYHLARGLKAHKAAEAFREFYIRDFERPDE